MNTQLTEMYTSILQEELRPALGCTEPIAIAYAACVARKLLGSMPTSASVRCSGNIIKNVKGVIVPNSGGQRGINVAATLGIVGGDPEACLQVLEHVTAEDVLKTQQLVADGFCKSTLATGVANLFIEVTVQDADSTASVTIEQAHTNITHMCKDGKELEVCSPQRIVQPQKTSRDVLTVAGILDYADHIDIGQVRSILEQQIQCNEAIAQEGLENEYGMGVGRTLLNRYDGTDVRIRARAKAAAGSDARMSGSPMPVVINSGSGNQGLTVSLPVIEYARELGVDHETMLRALIVSNLVAIHQKQYLGSLSAFCGAVSAATGAASAISYLHGGDVDAVGRTITDTLATVGGIVCDGAKPSCAAKISSALEAAILGYEMGTQEVKAFSNGEGLVKGDVEATIKSFGRMGREGMRSTDEEILTIMMEQ